MSPRSDEMVGFALERLAAVPDDLVRPLQKAHDLRVAVDYDAQRVSEDEARELLAAPERLVDAVSEAYGGR